MPTVLTIGHSTRPIDEFIGLLQAHGVKRLVDVRTIPRSAHNPQFNSASLEKSLEKAGIRYLHLRGLGGLRHARRDSPNTGWRNASFRGFADYMQGPEFEQALNELIQLAEQQQVVVMCAEAVPWRCHRSLIADALLVRGIPVEHIMSATSRMPHHLTPFARANGTRLLYPSADPTVAPSRSARVKASSKGQAREGRARGLAPVTASSPRGGTD